MTRFIAPLALVIAVTLSGVAVAAPQYGNGLAMAAANGTLTPHGIFDGH